MCMNTKRHVCGICMKLKSLLKTHYRQVKGASPSDIKRPKYFTKNSSLGRKFSCLICKKFFRFKTSLQGHLRSHPVSGTHSNIKTEVKDESDEEDDGADCVNENDAQYDTTEIANRAKLPLNQGENEEVRLSNAESTGRSDVANSEERIHNNAISYRDDKENQSKFINKCDVEHSREQVKTDGNGTKHLKETQECELSKPQNPTKSKCSYCDFITVYKQALKLHITRKHPEYAATEKTTPEVPVHMSSDGFSCIICQKVFTKKRYLQDHVRRTHGRRWKELDHSAQSSFTRTPSETVKAESVPENIQEKIPENTSPTQAHNGSGSDDYSCPICPKGFRNRKAVRDHTRQVHKRLWTSFKEDSANGERHSCPICQKQFRKITGVQDHTRRMHNKPWTSIKAEADSDAKIFPCPVCQKKMKTIKAVRDHTRTVHKRRWTSFGEDVRSSLIMASSKTPKSEGILETSARLPSVCKICSKTFRLPSLLAYHMRVHTGERPHPCGICGFRFSYKGSLVYHLRTHSGEKPHKCPYCERCFNSPSSRKKHILTHTREYNHSCHICGRQFLLRSHLLGHLKMHAGVKNHQCDQCPKAFTRLCFLRSHYTVHTAQRPYVCETCGVTFKWLKSLTQHKNTQHPESQQREESTQDNGTHASLLREESEKRLSSEAANDDNTHCGILTKHKDKNEAESHRSNSCDVSVSGTNLNESDFAPAAHYQGYEDLTGRVGDINEENLNPPGVLNQVQILNPNSENFV